MGLKSYDENRIKSVEVIQLIILYNLFARKESKNIIFQGGTALRWFHGNERFSEDLDFVTSLHAENVPAMLKSLRTGIEADVRAQFGPGMFSLKQKEKKRGGSFTVFAGYAPEGQRGKATVKLEFETLRSGALPDERKVILSSAPAVSYFIRKGEVMIPPGRIINVETPAEIYSDKVRALMERNYLKGRDLYDVWFMTETLKMAPDVDLVRKKLEMYEHPFVLMRKPEYYIELVNNPGSIMAARAREDVDRDLSRFIHDDVMDVFRKEGFNSILAAVGNTFKTLLEDGLDLSMYPAGM